MTIQGKDVKKIVVACDAGMGSSVMLASQLRRQLSERQVTVEHTPVNSIPVDADVIVCHEALAARARVSAPGTAIVAVQLFIGDPAVTTLIAAVKDGGTVDG